MTMHEPGLDRDGIEGVGTGLASPQRLDLILGRSFVSLWGKRGARELESGNQFE